MGVSDHCTAYSFMFPSRSMKVVCSSLPRAKRSPSDINVTLAS